MRRSVVDQVFKAHEARRLERETAGEFFFWRKKKEPPPPPLPYEVFQPFVRDPKPDLDVRRPLQDPEREAELVFLEGVEKIDRRDVIFEAGEWTQEQRERIKQSRLDSLQTIVDKIYALKNGDAIWWTTRAQRGGGGYHDGWRST